MKQMYLVKNANTSEIYKIAPFEYGIVDNLGKIRTNYGETLEKKQYCP